MGDLDSGQEVNYKLKDKDNGVYAFVLEGTVEIDGNELGQRDALGILETESFKVKSVGESRVLLMEIPMTN